MSGTEKKQNSIVASAGRTILLLAVSAGMCMLMGCSGKSAVELDSSAAGSAPAAEVSAGTDSAVEESAPSVDTLDRSAGGWTLIWNDEFEGAVLDTSKWSYQLGTGSQYGLDSWGNNEQQTYTDSEDNIRTEDGNLVITAIKNRLSQDEKYYTSARIRTLTNDDEVLFSTTYGRIEARMKLPAEEGLWPAFWMLPVDPSIYGNWSASGEIDIMEAKGRLPDAVGGTLHFGQVWPNNSYKSSDYIFPEDTDISDYHLYSIEWDPGEIRWYVDDNLYFTLNNWYSQGKNNGTDYTFPAPCDVPFYLVLNLAAGGNFDSEADLHNAEFPASMYVDYVRVYQQTDGYDTTAAGTPEVAADNLDTEAFEQFAATYEDGEYIADPDFETLNVEPVSDTASGIDPDSKDWQFAVGNFGGEAAASQQIIDGSMFAVFDISKGGDQTYSVQLIQHLPIIEGYTYQVSFDAKASESRTIVAAPGGDADNSWVKYFSYEASLDTQMQNYSFTFKMSTVTDPTARLEFNIGNKADMVWIGNVSVKLLSDDAVDAGDAANTARKALPDGNLIYNGTFDQGAGRLAFWNVEDADAVIPDYETDAAGNKNYVRRIIITAEGDAANINQTGIQLEGGDYAVTCQIISDMNSTVRILLADSEGVIYAENICVYSASDGTKEVEAILSVPEGIDDINAVFMVELENGSTIRLDNIKLKRLPDQDTPVT